MPTLVGIDHRFSFPLLYLEKYGLPQDRPTFLKDFQSHWPTDENVYLEFIRDGRLGHGVTRVREMPCWRRVTEGSAVANADSGGHEHVGHPPVQCEHTVKDASSSASMTTGSSTRCSGA